jgi:ABC-type multidrug transport system fused ATPase/permease subunit
MVALFRIEPMTEGSIIIDGVDINSVELRLLRSRIGIIPQEPLVFSTTVRFNLDPFKSYSDVDIWNVLESVNMKDSISSLPEKLLEPVLEGGENFSVGQRQLLCMARVLLRLVLLNWFKCHYLLLTRFLNIKETKDIGYG